jgi:hypothetical protein
VSPLAGELLLPVKSPAGRQHVEHQHPVRRRAGVFRLVQRLLSLHERLARLVRRRCAVVKVVDGD